VILSTRTVGRRQIIRSGAPWPTMPADRQGVQIGGYGILGWMVSATERDVGPAGGPGAELAGWSLLLACFLSA
jgi:hypothetical protein